VFARGLGMEDCKCHNCHKHIDRSDCQINYGILTLVDNKTIPVTKITKYLCSDCITYFDYSLTLSTIFEYHK
jgi:hypothetical protein